MTHAGLPNLRTPLALDLERDANWPCAPESMDAVFASNVMHIAPIATTAALFRGAARHLKTAGTLLVYGAVFLPDEEPVASNVAFDRELRERNPAYGVRTLAQLSDLAADAGLGQPVVRRMPNHNVMLRFVPA